MNKTARALVLTALLTGIAAPALAAWGSLLAWEGKYASDRGVRSNRAPLLEQPELRPLLRKVLPRAEANALARLKVETPVRRSTDYLLVHACRQHNCGNEMAFVVINVKDDKVWVGLFSREPGRVSTRWYSSSDDYLALPEEIRKDFVEQHTN